MRGMQAFALILASGNPTGLNGTNKTSNLSVIPPAAPPHLATVFSTTYCMKATTGRTQPARPQTTTTVTPPILSSSPSRTASILWYTDSNGNLYRGVRTAEGSNLASGGGLVSSPAKKAHTTPTQQWERPCRGHFETVCVSEEIFSNKQHGTLRRQPQGHLRHGRPMPSGSQFWQLLPIRIQPAQPVQVGSNDSAVQWTGGNQDLLQGQQRQPVGFDNADSSTGGNRLENAFDSDAVPG